MNIIQKFNVNSLSLSEIILSNKSCSTVTFLRNVYANSSVFETFLYDIKHTSFMS